LKRAAVAGSAVDPASTTDAIDLLAARRQISGDEARIAERMAWLRSIIHGGGNVRAFDPRRAIYGPGDPHPRVRMHSRDCDLPALQDEYRNLRFALEKAGRRAVLAVDALLIERSIPADLDALRMGLRTLARAAMRCAA